MKRNREVKGFTLLELLVVLLIVALISAVGYPNFLSWSKDREVRQASEKLANSITSINTQTQRGTYSFTQLLIVPSSSGVIFKTKGKNKKSFSDLVNAGTPVTCDTTSSAFWNNHQIKIDDIKEVYVHFDNAGQATVVDDANVDIDNYIIICGSNSDCDTEPAKPAYMVVWSQFGNVSRFKYGKDAWVRQ